MALISKIRKNSWLLVVLIALGLIGFIVMDMTSGQQSVFGSSQTIVGDIEGKKLDWNQFYRTEQVLYGNSGGDLYSRRSQLWNYFVEEALVKEEAEALGLGVSKTELLDLQFGTNPSPVIQQRFRNPQTGQVDFQQLNQIKTAIEDGSIAEDPRLMSYWAHQENEIIKERLQSKINTLVSKAIYTPTWMAEMGHAEQNAPISLAYVKVPFDEVDNAEVTLSDADYEAYLKENAEQYKNDEETRILEYVVFEVKPTVEDSAALRNRLAELLPEFETTEDDTAFTERNYGVPPSTFLTEDAISASIKDTVMNMPEGSVYGPYIDQGKYRAVKLVERRMIADSADTRHILIQAQAPEQFVSAEKTIDSLQNLLETNQASFDSLAIKFSQDPGSASDGGKYEGVTPGQFVPEFNEVLFITGDIGKLYKVRTSYGWHLVEVLSRSASTTPRVKVAYLEEAIVPLEETQENIEADVLAFIGENRDLETLRENAAARGLDMKTSTGLTRNAFSIGELGGGQASRDIVRWAFNASVGEVSPELYGYQDPVDYYTNKYVVVGLRARQAAGLPSVANIKSQIEQQVINKKKAEMLAGKISGTDLPSIAQQFGTQVDTAQNVAFNATFVPSLGFEPKVIGKAYTMEQGSVSAPIEGKTGVFVVKVLSKPAAGQPNNIPELRRTMSSPVQQQVPARLIQAMKKNADIEDNRSRFY
ncbi:peptidylprolyl isomerase [Phaeodactylibacter sp.]|jgi:peptidyl-prolyl cis-trans isomerase D|uniref:peptidylprolyl isomerase n=1 Tax=Phaeodactylibacter sp. TaxID=1940289 RepID=UPI0025D9F648|nr:peptidylprolyl isomerase [Phaeodactylibacter sp.]MCI4650464.1 peptidylprolyl isomerase [Phaeodactylibacter sp.]MCI5093520.1 peptidylprolyl isomerase [Phaeodactylibacter sp.]